MINRQYFIDFWENKKKRNRLVIAIIIIVVLAVISFGGYMGYNKFEKYLENQEKEKQKEIQEIQEQFDAKEKALIIELDSIKNIETVIIKDFWNDYNREKNRADKLQKVINSIRYNVYTRKQLDSIAEYVNYNKS